MTNNDFEKVVLSLAQGAINGIGEISVPVKVDSGELSFSVNPKIDLSKVDLEHFDVSQINISDTELAISFGTKLNKNVNATFSVDSKLSDFTKTIDANGTTFKFNIAGTDINQTLSVSLGVSDSMMSIVSPSGTNDFKLDFGFKAKL